MVIQGKYRFFFSLVQVQSTKKLIQAWLGVSRPIYVNVDSPNLGFTYFNFLGGVPVKKNTLYVGGLFDWLIDYFGLPAPTGGKAVVDELCFQPSLTKAGSHL